MFTTSATTEVLARAIDVCALRQAVYSANIANANVEGYQRLEVQFDEAALQVAAAGKTSFKQDASGLTAPQVVVDANSTVKLDEEMAAMARNALRYQTLLGAYERSMGLLKMAIHEGREA
jgi:flagellar basal-body rod protein FlgB